jgi:mono/diheme cytochrome c family protein
VQHSNFLIMYKLVATKMRFSILFSIIIIILQSTGCSGEKTSNTGSLASDKVQTEALSKDLMAGQEIYKKYCLSCHQASGKGVSGMYPPLEANPNLTLSTDTLIYTVLRGRAGKMVVNGNDYAGIMAPHNFLSDEQVANVLNFVLNGMNKFNLSIKAEEVTRIRAKVK